MEEDPDFTEINKRAQESIQRHETIRQVTERVLEMSTDLQRETGLSSHDMANCLKDAARHLTNYS